MTSRSGWRCDPHVDFLSLNGSSEAQVSALSFADMGDLPTYSQNDSDRPTGSDMDLAVYLAEQARGYPGLITGLEECGCAICREALRILEVRE